MEIIICVRNVGGCGYVAESGQWRDVPRQPGIKECPQCGQVKNRILNDGNFKYWTDSKNRIRAMELLDVWRPQLKGEDLLGHFIQGSVDDSQLSQEQWDVIVTEMLSEE